MSVERDQAMLDQGKAEIETALLNAVPDLRFAGASEREIRDLIEAAIPEPKDAPAMLCGVPLSEVEILTLDGRRWLEVLGEIHREVRPGGSVVLTAKLAQVPGGKSRKDGLSPGDTISFFASRVIAVGRQGDRVRRIS